MDQPGVKKVAAVTLGCKLNYAESSSILEGLAALGWHIVERPEEAGLIIVHTCAVTGEAERKCRQRIRGLIRRNPGAAVVAIGCYSQLRPEQLAGIEGVRAVLGTEEKFLLDRYEEAVSGTATGVAVEVGPLSAMREAHAGSSLPAGSGAARTRAFLKIQDGCDYGCSYCTIPLARGRSRSLPPEAVVARAHALAASGYRELVLTGVNTGDYRFGTTGFAELLGRLEEVAVPRIRISSLEPDLLSDRVLQAVAASRRIVPHFHLPLQSGSDRVLRLMGRRYDTATYRERLEAAMGLIEGCAVGADVMVGFPGEEEADFEAMYRFLEALPLAYLHVFNCSVRPSTALESRVSSGRAQRVHPKEAARRSALLSALGRRHQERFASGFVGSSCRVLFEECRPLLSGGFSCSGYSPNYLRVVVEDVRGGLAGRELPVELAKLGEDLNLYGRLLS